jgi:hypothetical protein
MITVEQYLSFAVRNESRRMNYTATRSKFVLLIFALLTGFSLQAQDTTCCVRTMQVHPELHIGVTAGGHLYNGRFIYRTGKTLQLGASIDLSERMQAGLSAGAEKYEKELFLPFAVHFTGFIGKSANTFLTTQVGYAAGINKKVYSYTNYEYNGGWLFSPGAGYRFRMKKSAVVLGAGYKHQFAHYKYFTADQREYKESDNFNLIYFRLGLQL